MVDVEKYNRNVTLLCPTCGLTQFEYDSENNDDNSLIKCVSCGRTMTKKELIDANDENISAHIEEMGKDIVDDLQNDLRKSFAGNRFIKIK